MTVAGLRVSLMKVLEHYLTPQQFKRYVKAERANQLASPQHFYNAALRDLSIRDTESAIFHLIRVFELEPRHLPSLHLARTMLFGLNKLFQEAGGELYKSKFPNLNSYRQRLEKQIQDLELEDQRVRNEMLQNDTKKGFLGGLFGGNQKKAQRQAQLSARAHEIQNELASLNKRKAQTLKLAQIQDFANVISLMLEVCMFPARYSWLAEEKRDQAGGEGSGYQLQVWYG